MRGHLNGNFKGYAFAEKVLNPQSMQQPATFDRFGMFTSRDITLPLASLAYDAIDYFKLDIIQYLGADCRLDDLYCSWFNPQRASIKNVSGGWHDDNCGHRLKIFICIKGDGSTPTVILPESNRRPYSFRSSEFIRFFGYADQRSLPGEVFLRYKTGDIAMFDTNGLHRGLYEETASERVVLIAEFMNRQKSNKISGKAPCGPGSAPMGKVCFDADASKLIIKTGLIDTQLCRQVGGGFEYSLSHRCER